MVVSLSSISFSILPNSSWGPMYWPGLYGDGRGSIGRGRNGSGRLGRSKTHPHSIEAPKLSGFSSNKTTILSMKSRLFPTFQSRKQQLEPTNRAEQALSFDLGRWSQTAPYLSVDDAHMEPVKSKDSPDLHSKLRLLTDNDSRQKIDPSKNCVRIFLVFPCDTNFALEFPRPQNAQKRAQIGNRGARFDLANFSH